MANHIQRLFRPLLACSAFLLFCEIAQTQGPSDLEREKIALDALTREYNLDYHEKDSDGYVIDLRLQGKQFDDKALDYAIEFKRLIGLSIRGSSITDDGLAK